MIITSYISDERRFTPSASELTSYNTLTTTKYGMFGRRKIVQLCWRGLIQNILKSLKRVFNDNVR